MKKNKDVNNKYEMCSLNWKVVSWNLNVVVKVSAKSDEKKIKKSNFEME